MGVESEHSKWSASSFHRRLPVEEGGCPASFQAEQGKPDDSSVYADEGTAAHTLASTYLQDFLKRGGMAKPLDGYIGDVIKAGERTFKVTREMVDFVSEYTDAVLIEGRDPWVDIFVEERVNYSRYLDVPREEGWGTADAILINWRAKHITVKDLKYGFTLVLAEWNAQEILYGLGVIDEFSHICDLSDFTIELVIHQPRLQGRTESRWSTTVAELKQWAEDVAKPAVVEAEQPGAPFNPTEKSCQFCKARHSCEAKRIATFSPMVQAASIDDFVDLTAAAPKALAAKISSPAELTDAQLLVALKMTPLIENWVKAVRGETERRAFATGQPIAGTKIVTGRQGDRKWTDEKAAADLIAQGGQDPYDKSVISPTTAEKRLKKLAPATWTGLQELISRAPGKPSVVLDTDSREAITLQASPDDFDDMTTAQAQEHSDVEDMFDPTGQERAAHEKSHPFR
jgi:hypothetical protein